MRNGTLVPANTAIGLRRDTSIVQWLDCPATDSLHALAIGCASTRAVVNAVAPVGVDEDTDNHFTSR